MTSDDITFFRDRISKIRARLPVRNKLSYNRISGLDTVGDVVLEIGTGGSASLISKKIDKIFSAPLCGATKLGSFSKLSHFLRSQSSVSISKT